MFGLLSRLRNAYTQGQQASQTGVFKPENPYPPRQLLRHILWDEGWLQSTHHRVHEFLEDKKQRGKIDG